MTAEFPELVAAMRTIQRDLVIDGELAICDDRGCPQFARLGPRARLRRPDRIDEAAAKDPAAIFAFDLLELDGEDYRAYPLVIRKGMLQHALSRSGRIFDRSSRQRTVSRQDMPVTAQSRCRPLWPLAELRCSP
jgi:ATP-dependent DNA ligase